MTISFRYLLLLLLLTSCAAETVVTDDPTPTEVGSFTDDFETATNDFNLLFPADGARWTAVQQVDPSNGANSISLTNEVVSSGSQALRVFARSGDEPLSKMDIEKSGFMASAGQRVIIEADIRIDSDANLANLLLIDLECCSCWDPSVPDNKCPGVRLMMSNENDFLSIERGKIGGATLRQTTTPFPRFTWNSLRWEMVLSPDEDGQNSLWLNGTEIVQESGMNLPNAAVFAEQGANNGLDFVLQEPVFYERLQI
ncbi:MAG: heparin lyase I family protein, partial [Bacteroidota bacterium]